MLKEIIAAFGIGIICGYWIGNYGLFGGVKNNFNFKQDIVDGWKIYKIPNISYTWKTNSPIIHETECVDSNYTLIKIPAEYRIKFIFYV